jgi:hypothetical protein
MAIAEEAETAHTILSACGHCFEMATRLVEPPVDYLESVLSTSQGSRTNCVLHCSTWQSLVFSQLKCCTGRELALGDSFRLNMPVLYKV